MTHAEHHGQPGRPIQFLERFTSLAKKFPIISTVVESRLRERAELAKIVEHDARREEYYQIQRDAPRMTLAQFQALPNSSRAGIHIKLSAHSVAVNFLGHTYDGGR